MTVGDVWLSFHGRMTRSELWVKGVLPLLPLGLVNGILFWSNPEEPHPISIVVSLLLLWPSLALYAKRLHDHDRSAWLLATILIPIAGIVFAIWIVVKSWFLRGTVGQNRFGEDPLGPEDEAPAPAATGLEASAAVQSWTWADLLSSYRYWALVSLAALSSLNMGTHSTFALLAGREIGLSPENRGLLIVRTLAVPVAFLLAWAVSRSRPVRPLFVAGALQCLGGLLLWLGASPAPFLLGALLLHSSWFAILLGVPVALVGARGKAWDFFVAYGTCWLFKWLLELAGGIMGGLAAEREGLRSALSFIPLIALLEIYVLVPANGRLFAGSPPPRGRALDPVPRSPVAVTLLAMIVPFYAHYWLYRAHGEAARLTASRRLLGPAVAVVFVVVMNLIVLLVPISLLQGIHIARDDLVPAAIFVWVVAAITFVPVFAILPVALVEELNAAAHGLGAKRVGSVPAAFIFGLLLPPVAFGLVQAALGRLDGLARAAAATAGPAAASGIRGAE